MRRRHRPIIIQAVVPVLDSDSAEDLAARVLKEEHDLPSGHTAVRRGKAAGHGRRSAFRTTRHPARQEFTIRPEGFWPGNPGAPFKTAGGIGTMNETGYDFTIENLGERTIPSPVVVNYYTPDDRRILFNIDPVHFADRKAPDGSPLSVEVAGPREKIFFDPSKTKAAIVTCGGLCPGINDVIRASVMELYHRYGVRNIQGIRYGFQGLVPKYGHALMELTPDTVKDIHGLGGSCLSSSRGRQEIGEMVDALRRMNVDIFFCIGGDGTMRATENITREIMRRNLSIGVIGIPKTIDNDLNLIQKTFGYDTAISEAVRVIQCAHVEAKGAPHGIGLVKLMGRLSGHIAVGAALAQSETNFVLIPEVPFDLDGEKGFLKALEQRLRERPHCVILVAEGAGQDLVPTPGEHGDGRLGERTPPGHRPVPEGSVNTSRSRTGDQPEVHRSQLYPAECGPPAPATASTAAPGPVRRSCRHGGKDRHAGGTS